MLEKLQYVKIPDPDRFRTVHVCYAIADPPNSPWGALTPLMGSSWSGQIPVVSGEILSHALHGLSKPLWEALGVPPRVRALRVALKARRCVEYQERVCEHASAVCVPGSSKLPGCYVAPFPDLDLRRVASEVGKAWDEGRYVFVVDGPEFVF